MNENLLEEAEYFEEWYQPEVTCLTCGCIFMYQSYPKFPKYPTYCPNCGIKFAGLKQGKSIIYPLNKETNI